MKNSVYLIIAAIAVTFCSCDKTEIVEKDLSTLEIQSRSISDDDLERIENVLIKFFELDTGTLRGISDSMEINLNNSVYTKGNQMWAEFGITQSLIDELLLVDAYDIGLNHNDEENFILDPKFEGAYESYIQSGKSIIFEYVNNTIQPRGIRDWFNDPCGPGATMALVGWNSIRLLAAGIGAGTAVASGGASLIGTAVAIVSVVDDTIQYAKDCA